MNYEDQRRGFIFVSLLKACAKKKDFIRGKRLHDDVTRKGLLEKIPYLAASVINMYAKCGFLTKAQEVIEELHDPNIESWNALISGYANENHGSQAVDYFKRMKCEGIFPDVVTFTCILKACGKTRDLSKGKEIHNEIVSRDLLRGDVVLGTAMVDMYAKCGMLSRAQMVFDRLLVRNVVTWNALIAGYGLHERFHEALTCYERMRKEGFSPDIVTFICLLKACGCVKGGIKKGEQIHDEIVSTGLLEKDVVLGSALVDMYAKCGMIRRAQQVLEEIPIRNIFSWSSLIQGYVQMDQGQEALNCFDRMRSEGLSPDAITFICVLKACSKTGRIEIGENIHAEIVRRGLLENDVVLGNALLDMYAKCGALAKTKRTFEEFSVRDLVSWNSLITGYASQGRVDEALFYIEMMQIEGLFPDAVTYISILKECGSTQRIDMGEQIHDDIVDTGLLEKNIILGNALVDMYTKCGMLLKAQQVLEDLPFRDVITWNALISGYAQQGQGHEALTCFKQMQSEGLSPDATTLVCILKSCGSLGAMVEGIQIHEESARSGWLYKDIPLGNTLIDMYAKCGLISKAQEVLEGLPLRDVVSWNALIAGYSYQRQCLSAWNSLARMGNEGFSPDLVTFICILSACANMGAIDYGEQIHDQIVMKGLLEKYVVIGNALIDMYAKCGLLGKARRLLEELPIRDIVSWNSLIGGYAQQGQGHEALKCQQQMQNEGCFPDEVTFVCFLSACSHSGLLNTAQLLFGSMVEKYGVTPNLEHHTCMVVGFAYVGHFEKAISVIKVMPSFDYPPVWIALLSACRKWGNVKLGRSAFHQVIQLDEGLGGAYVLMANIFAAAGMQEDAKKVEAMRLKHAAFEELNTTIACAERYHSVCG